MILATATRALPAAVATMTLVAILLTAVAAFVNVKVRGGPTDVVFVRAAVRAMVDVDGHREAPGQIYTTILPERYPLWATVPLTNTVPLAGLRSK